MANEALIERIRKARQQQEQSSSPMLERIKRARAQLDAPVESNVTTTATTAEPTIREGDTIFAPPMGLEPGLIEIPESKPQGKLPRPQEEEEDIIDVGRRFIENLPETLKRRVGATIQSVGEFQEIATAMPGGLLLDPTGQMEKKFDWRKAGEENARVGERIYRVAQEELARNAPNVPEGGFKEWTYEFANVIADMASTWAIAGATRSPLAGTLDMMANVGTREYAQSRAEGQAPSDAFLDAKFYAVTEALTELPFLDNLLKYGGADVGLKIARGIGIEAAGEGINQVMQMAYEIRKSMRDDDMSFADAWKKEGGFAAIRDAMVMGGAVGGAITAGQEGASQALEKAKKAYDDREKRIREAITPEDNASPIDNTTIGEGKVLVEDAIAQAKMNDILRGVGMPDASSRVSVDYGDGRIERGTLEEGYTADSAEAGTTDTGIRIKLDNGQYVDELVSTLERAGVKVTPELEQQIQQATAEPTQATAPLPLDIENNVAAIEQKAKKLRETIAGTQENIKKAINGEIVISLDDNEQKAQIAQAEKEIQGMGERANELERRAREIREFHNGPDGKVWRDTLKAKAVEMAEAGANNDFLMRMIRQGPAQGARTLDEQIQSYVEMADKEIRRARVNRGEEPPINYVREWKLTDRIAIPDENALQALIDNGITPELARGFDAIGKKAAALGLKIDDLFQSGGFGPKSEKIKKEWTDLANAAELMGQQMAYKAAGAKQFKDMRLREWESDYERALATAMDANSQPAEPTEGAKAARRLVEIDNEIKQAAYSQAREKYGDQWKGRNKATPEQKADLEAFTQAERDKRAAEISELEAKEERRSKPKKPVEAKETPTEKETPAKKEPEAPAEKPEFKLQHDEAEIAPIRELADEATEYLRAREAGREPNRGSFKSFYNYTSSLAAYIDKHGKEKGDDLDRVLGSEFREIDKRLEEKGKEEAKQSSARRKEFEAQQAREKEKADEKAAEAERKRKLTDQPKTIKEWVDHLVEKVKEYDGPIEIETKYGKFKVTNISRSKQHDNLIASWNNSTKRKRLNWRQMDSIAKALGTTRLASVRKAIAAAQGQGLVLPSNAQKTPSPAPPAGGTNAEFRKAVSKATKLKGVNVLPGTKGIAYDPLIRSLYVAADVPVNNANLKAAADLARAPVPAGWRDVEITATVEEDGADVTMKAGELADILRRRIEKLTSLLECMKK